jgi:hypothetical protein
MGLVFRQLHPLARRGGGRLRSPAAFALLLSAGGFAAQSPPPKAQPAARQIAIVRASIQEFEDGPATPASVAHVPGESIFFSFQLENYQVSSDEKVKIAWTVDALDPQGVRLVETGKGLVDVPILPEDKQWRPKIRRTFVVPPLAASGIFKIVATVKDEIGGSSATHELTFEVRGHRVEPSPSLAIRNLRFLRSEDDKPLAIAAYRAGDALWAKFDITGFRYGDGNRIDLVYGIAIVAPSGKTMFSQPEAAVEQGGSFYPKRYVPGEMNLTVQPGTTKGEYKLIVTAQDRVGKQSAEAQGAFRIE